MTKLPIIEVRSSAAVDAFIGFTVLPKSSRGKRYQLVEYTGEEEPPALDEDLPWVPVDPAP